MPPLLAAQVQIHAAEPSAVTAEAAPTSHRLVDGAALVVSPLAEPHTPSTGGPPDELLPEPLDEELPEDELDELLLEPEDELDELARLAPQSEAVPPPLPWQIQVHGPAPETGDAVPDLHRLVAGAVLTVVLLADPHAPFTTVALRVAAHCAVVPPFAPAQFQLNGPLPLTLDAVPVVHRLAAGAVLTLCPFDAPHAPFTACACRLAEHCAVPPPLLPAQLHVHGPLPLMPDAMPALHRLVAGARLAAVPLALPQAPLVISGARHSAIVPPPVPEQLHVHGPLPEIVEAAPEAHNPLEGSTLAATPLAAPHAPLAAWIVASHPAVVPPPAPAQLHSHGPLPAIVEAVPAAHRFEEGALLSTCPFDGPHAPFTGTPPLLEPLLDEPELELPLEEPPLDEPEPELPLEEPLPDEPELELPPEEPLLDEPLPELDDELPPW